MSWVKLDDRFDDHYKVKRVWQGCPEALGLHTMALTYCCRHASDGLVDYFYVSEKVPNGNKRKRLTNALVDAGLWDTDEKGWRIHDFLDFNPSRAEIEEKRRQDAERKAHGRDTQSAKRPRGVRAESAGNPNGVRDVSSGPVPTHPDPQRNNPPNPPTGGSRGRVRSVTKDGVFAPSKVLDDVERALYEQMGVSLPPGATAADAEIACEGGAA